MSLYMCAQAGGPPTSESLQQLLGSDALWVQVDERSAAAVLEDHVVAAVEHMLAGRVDVMKDLQVRPV